MIHELVYVSRSVGFWVNEKTLEELLIDARETNEGLDVTGVLLCHEGEFIQLLEGPEQAVRDLFYKHIACDPRHRRVIVCWEYHKRERCFPNWQMGFARAADLAGENAIPAGFLKEGVSGLDLSGPRSTGRDLLLSIYETIIS